MKEFRDTLDECCFADLGYKGPKFTWFKRLSGGITVWEHLDRVVANPEWLTLFPGSSVRHLDSVFYDHKPIIIHPDGIQARSRRPWRFEQVWLKDEMCHSAVESTWSPAIFSPFPMTVIEGNTVQCQSKLRLWSKTSFGNINRALIEKKNLVKKAEEEVVKGGNIDRLLMLKVELRDLLSSEEKLWQQRSKLHWLKEGDQNTRHFHGKTSQHFRRNSVKRLMDSNGVWRDGDEKVVGLFIDYSNELFTSSNPSHIGDVLESVSWVVTEQMNSELLRVFTRQEVDVALKQMAPLKASGPDGMPPIFYQHYWSSTGEDVSCAMLSCLNSGTIPASLNHTYITLVPKSKCPELVTEFRPISLCNILYKLISKVIANRLKSLLPHVVSESQSAF